jgi:hypothetical protein
MATFTSDSDDEDWSDDYSLDDEDASSCPECGGTVYSFTEKCPHCGYWLSDADRRAMYPGKSKPLWLRVTAWALLIAFLVSLLGVVLTLF